MLNNTPDNFAYEITPPCAIYASSTIEPTAQRSFTRFSPGVKGAGTRPKWLIQQDTALNISLIYYRGVIIKFGQTVLPFKLSLNLSLSFSFFHVRPNKNGEDNTEREGGEGERVDEGRKRSEE